MVRSYFFRRTQYHNKKIKKCQVAYLPKREKVNENLRRQYVKLEKGGIGKTGKGAYKTDLLTYSSGKYLTILLIDIFI